ncbi:MAG TPA: DUF2849 domain-containing protein [Rhizomicrobium sp.]|nr:DUF2849 domain-containing protein [Rhizomicrobium sp.]
MAASVLQVLTANRLRDGDVVYWRAGAWVEAFVDAEILPDKPQADAALAGASDDVKARRVVNPYLFPVSVEGDRVRAVEEREIVRSEGPSVRRDLGKQAVLTSPSWGGRTAQRSVAVRVGGSGESKNPHSTPSPYPERGTRSDLPTRGR